MSDLDGEYRTELITPQMAEFYLGRNVHNRNIRERDVNGYAADMSSGNWHFTGDPIKFDHNGNLIDGQHRLWAIIMANVPIKMAVVRGLAPASQEVVDCGTKRSFADQLKLRGETYTAQLSATLRMIWIWEAGVRQFNGSAKATYPQLSAVLEKYPTVREGMATVERARAHSNLPASVGGLTWWLFHQIDAGDGQHFFDHLISGEGLVSGNPILALRRWLDANKGPRGQRGSRNSTYLAAITCKAWNKFRDGEETTILSWRPGGASPEKFPEPH